MPTFNIRTLMLISHKLIYFLKLSWSLYFRFPKATVITKRELNWLVWAVCDEYYYKYYFIFHIFYHNVMRFLSYP